MASEKKSIVVLGGAGSFGRAIIQQFGEAGWTTYSADLGKNDEATQSIELTGEMAKDASKIVQAVGDDGRQVDAVVAVAGGWAGSGIGEEEVFESTERMIRFNLFSSVVAGHVAAKLLKQTATAGGGAGGLLVFTGAEAATSGTPGMIGYGVSKAGVHHLVRSLAMDDSGVPNSATVCAILPRILDTPANRSAMPTANFADWTPLSDLASILITWATDPSSRPVRGSLIKLVTVAGVTTSTVTTQL